MNFHASFCGQLGPEALPKDFPKSRQSDARMTPKSSQSKRSQSNSKVTQSIHEVISEWFQSDPKDFASHFSHSSHPSHTSQFPHFSRLSTLSTLSTLSSSAILPTFCSISVPCAGHQFLFMFHSISSVGHVCSLLLISGWFLCQFCSVNVRGRLP